MKKNTCWSMAAAFIISILVAWLRVIKGGQLLPYWLLVVTALTLGWFTPQWSWLAAILLAAGIPLLHVLSETLGMVPHAPFSWLGDVILPVVFCFPAAFFGSALGWMHNIVKDDF